MSSIGMKTATSSKCFSRGTKRAGVSLGGMAVHELGEAQRGHEAKCGRWQQAHMPIIITEFLELIYGAGSKPLVKLGSVLAIGTELARDKAFDWAMVTAEDLGERIQAFAIAMSELVGVQEVDRGEEPYGVPPPGKGGCPRPIFDWEEGYDDYQHIIGEVVDKV